MPEEGRFFDTVSLCNFLLSDAESVLEHRYRRQAYITGEASCIAVANQTGAAKSRKIVVTDDRAARKQCHQLHIPFTGTIGILKAGVSEDRLSADQADIYLDRMIRQGFYSPVRSIYEITDFL